MEGEQSDGPFSEEQIHTLVRSSALAKTTLIWSPGSEKWKPIKDVFDLEDELPPPLPSYVSSDVWQKKAQVFKKAWSENPPHPWRRYFARTLDIAINGTFIFFCFGIVLGVLSPHFAKDFFGIFREPGGQILDTIITTFVATFLTAAFIGFTGSSIGKWFFGVRVTDKQNTPIGYKLAWRREIAVWAKGLGIGIPIVTLFTLLSAYKHLSKEGKTTWDEKLDLLVVYHDNGPKQIILSIIGFALFVSIVAIIRSL
jgi:uncharacterized RDD family membrane protein YckC